MRMRPQRHPWPARAARCRLTVIPAVKKPVSSAASRSRRRTRRTAPPTPPTRSPPPEAAVRCASSPTPRPSPTRAWPRRATPPSPCAHSDTMSTWCGSTPLSSRPQQCGTPCRCRAGCRSCCCRAVSSSAHWPWSGRGRLYRRAKDRDRAAESLRAATALRLVRKLGLPPGTERAAVARTAAQATGWPQRTVDKILRGPIPSNDRALADLAVQLDRLESEVLSR